MKGGVATRQFAAGVNPVYREPLSSLSTNKIFFPDIASPWAIETADVDLITPAFTQ